MPKNVPFWWMWIFLIYVFIFVFVWLLRRVRGGREGRRGGEEEKQSGEERLSSWWEPPCSSPPSCIFWAGTREGSGEQHGSRNIYYKDDVGCGHAPSYDNCCICLFAVWMILILILFLFCLRHTFKMFHFDWRPIWVEKTLKSDAKLALCYLLSCWGNISCAGFLLTILGVGLPIHESFSRYNCVVVIFRQKWFCDFRDNNCVFFISALKFSGSQVFGVYTCTIYKSLPT